MTTGSKRRRPAPGRPARTEELRAEVVHWATELRVQPRRVRVQPMTRKWGSCSAAGTVTFATALLTQPAEFRTYVIVHELLHLRVSNHGRLFRSYLGAYVPGYQRFWENDEGRRDGRRSC